MRVQILAVSLLSVRLALPAADLSVGSKPLAEPNPPLKLTQVIKDGTLRVSAKNVSNKPILAYVVGIEDGGQSSTLHDYFTGRSSFAPGKTIELVFALHSPSDTPKVFVDFVRLSDRSTWGGSATEDGKRVAASFER